MPLFETIERLHHNYGLADPATIKGLDGFEQLLEIQEGNVPAPPMARTMNFVLGQIERGRVDLRGEPGVDHLNPMGIIHGGWMMTFLDSVLGFAVQTVLEAGETYVSLSTEVKFVRPLLAGGGQVRAIGELVSRSTRTAPATAGAEDRPGRVSGPRSAGRRVGKEWARTCK